MRRGSRANRLMDFWVGIPLLNLLAGFRRRRGWPEKVSRVGVMCSPAQGDALLLSGVLQDVRLHFPKAELVHFCMEQNLAAAELIPGADRRVVIALTRPAHTIRAMRAERLDVLLDFSAWQRLTAFYSMVAGARFTAGFQTAGMYRSRGYDVSIEHRNDRHEMENFRELLRGQGIVAGCSPQVVMPAGSLNPLAGDGDVIALHVCASGARSWQREWPEKYWIELAQRITGPKTLFAITGAPNDKERIAPLVRKLEQAGLRATAFVSTNGFVELARMLEEARLLVSVNTGVMHLGAIVGTPTVGLNGPTAGHRWGPVGRCCAGVAPADGSGGYLNLGFEYDGHAVDVMERITVDQVVAAVGQLMARCSEVV